MRSARAVLFVLAVAGVSPGAAAQVYKCTSPQGAVAFQDHACASGQRQQIMEVAAQGPPGYLPPAPATVAPPAVDEAPGVATPVAPPSPLPVMYACVGAVNGKRYLSAFVPRPYFAPVGMLGYPPQGLGEAYGPGHGVGMPVPVVKPRAGGAGIATGMTEVQDRCAPAPRAEVCRFVRGQYDENQHKLRMAMPSEQPPLEQQGRQLSRQLENC